MNYENYKTSLVIFISEEFKTYKILKSAYFEP